MFFPGLIVGLVLTVLVVWLIRLKITMKWYEWLIGALAAISLFATVQQYFGSIRENEPQAAWMGALIFGLIFLILVAFDWQLIRRRQKI